MPRVTASATTRSIMPTGPLKRFSVATTIDGYEVIDQDGRTVSNSYEFANRPLQIAGDLNEAARLGSASLRKALGAVYDDDDASLFVDDGEDYEYPDTNDVHAAFYA